MSIRNIEDRTLTSSRCLRRARRATTSSKTENQLVNAIANNGSANYSAARVCVCRRARLLYSRHKTDAATAAAAADAANNAPLVVGDIFVQHLNHVLRMTDAKRVAGRFRLRRVHLHTTYAQHNLTWLAL